MFRILSLVMLAFLGVSAVSYTSGIPEARKSINPFRIVKTEKDPALYIKQSRIALQFVFSQEPTSEQTLYLSINGLLENVKYTPGLELTYDLSPGKYQFKIWGGPGYEEVITDSILVEPQVKYTAEVDMRIYTNNEPVMVYKPVIYFHTNEAREFDLKVKPKGEFTFTYPSITEGWKGKVDTDGSITINNRKYPYLFWESKQQYQFQSSGNGYHLKREEIVSFLEKKCAELGFNDAARTDFITFWGMKMQAHEELFVQFLFDDQCNQFADLEFDKAPDSVRRVYICISDWDPSFAPYLKDTKFASMPEGDFTVLEWGGYEFKLKPNSFISSL